jgi:rhamnulokinase
VDFGLLGADGALIDNPRHYRDARTAGLPEEMFADSAARGDLRRHGDSVHGAEFALSALGRASASAVAAPKRQGAAVHARSVQLFSLRDDGGGADHRQHVAILRSGARRFATELLEKLGMPADFLAELVDPGQRLGAVRPAVAEACGLARETPVYTTAGHDTASAVAAVPAEGGTGWCYISSGTWSLMGMELERPLINEASLAANFTNEVGVGGSIRFLKNIPGLWLLQECRRAWAREGKEYSYDELIAMARETEPSGAVLELEAFQSAGQAPSG